MKKDEAESVGRALLRKFPDFIQLELIDDDHFREKLGLRLSGSIILGGATSFNRRDFIAAATARLAEADAVCEVIDQEGGAWRMTVETHDGRIALRLGIDTRNLLVFVPPGLKPTSAGRLEDFAKDLQAAGLAPDALASWRDILSERPLRHDEVGKLERQLNNTPIACAQRIRTQLHGDTTVEGLVPGEREYWENLCGAPPVQTLEALRKDLLPGHVAQLLAWNELEGAKQALLLAGHGNLLLQTDVARLPGETLLALADWAHGEGDLLAKIAIIELGLDALSRAPILEDTLGLLITDIFALEPEDEDGALQLLTGLLTVAEGQLSLVKTLQDWPPFRRRHAALAQASLISRVWGLPLGARRFTTWAMEMRGSRFYLQTLVDQRLEPRWSPEYVSAAQLKNEFIGRLHNVAERNASTIPDGKLADLLRGDGDASLKAQLRFPGAFVPGPLEGAAPATPVALPASIEAIVHESLAVETLEQRSIAALVNLRGLFSIGDDKIARATTLIRQAGYRLPADADDGLARSMLTGLADLAAISRSPALAADLRVMARRRRTENPDARYMPELLLAITAAAAHEDLEAWAKFAGDWISELAFNVEDKSQASQLLDVLETLCDITPYLRSTAGHSIVALRSFVLT